jgi:hypothetical protein
MRTEATFSSLWLQPVPPFGEIQPEIDDSGNFSSSS